jgi:sugar lactone lactonase YvrE
MLQFAIGTVGLTRSGGLVLALAGGFALSGPDGQDLRPFGDFSADRSVTRFNDGKPDPWGSFWAGTMAVPEDSGFPCSLYRLSPDGVVTELFGGVSRQRPGLVRRPPRVLLSGQPRRGWTFDTDRTPARCSAGGASPRSRAAYPTA